MADITFNGIKQVTLSTFNNTEDSAKKGFIWFVRDLNESGETLSSQIYLGTRLYGEVNDMDAEKFENLFNQFNGLLTSDGEWNGFLPKENHEILGTVSETSETPIYDLFSALESAIVALKEQVANQNSGLTEEVEALKEDVSGLTSDVAELNEKAAQIEKYVNSAETRLDAAEAEIEDLESGLTSETERAQAAESAITENLSNNYYTKEEVDGKVSGMYHFKGSVDTKDDLENIENPSNGDVYVVNNEGNQYAYDGENWVKISSTVDLSNYYTKDDTYSKSEVDDLFSGVTQHTITGDDVEE